MNSALQGPDLSGGQVWFCLLLIPSFARAEMSPNLCQPFLSLPLPWMEIVPLSETREGSRLAPGVTSPLGFQCAC